MTAEGKRTSLWAALSLNALIFPGSGHYALKLRGRGIAIMAAATTFVVWPLAAYTLAVASIARSRAGLEAPLMHTLNALSMAWQQERRTILGCLLALAITWLYSIVDVLILMAREERKAGGRS